MFELKKETKYFVPRPGSEYCPPPAGDLGGGDAPRALTHSTINPQISPIRFNTFTFHPAVLSQGVLLSTTKTDAKDACALALYGQVNNPKPHHLPSDKMLEISQLRTFLKQLKKQQSAISNQLHALEFHVRPLDFVRQELNKSLELCQAQIRQTEQHLRTISEQCFEKAYDLAT